MGSKEGRVPGKDVPEVQKPLLDEGEAEAEGGKEGRGEGMKETEKKLKELEDKIAGMDLDITQLNNRMDWIRQREKKEEERKYADMNRTSAFWWGMCLGTLIGVVIAVISAVV
jgi:hypothetical protein